MRQVKTAFQLSVMWVLVFVMAAGPLPLGIPRAEAAPTPTVTDTPGIQNFFTPKLFIIFDTSRSMSFRPNDPNSDPSAQDQDWDPTITHVLPDGGVAEGPDDPECVNKFCIGKRALSQTLPLYTSRIDMGLSGYNQYYQLTTEPENLYTDCNYDLLSYGNTDWANPAWKFTSLDDLNGTGTDPALLGISGGGVPFSYTPPTTVAPHSTRKWNVATGALGDLVDINTVAPGGSAGSTTTKGGYTYDWLLRRQAAPLDLLDKASLGGTCPVAIPNTTLGSCALEPCDMYPDLVPEELQQFDPFYSAQDLGPTVLGAFGATYTRNDPPAVRTFWAGCGLTGNYTGAGAGCNVLGNCTPTQITGPTDNPVGGIITYNDPSLSPGPTYRLVDTDPHVARVQITRVNATCPAVGSTVSASSGPVEWLSLATGGAGDGTLVTGATGCSGTAAGRCTWTVSRDYVVPAEANAHYCEFTRQSYDWQQFQTQCQYQVNVWTYSTNQGTELCRYRHDEDVYTHALYTYAWLPNDGDILGFDTLRWNGNDNLRGNTTAVTYSGGQFSNGFCPNLIANSATWGQCTNGVICKLSWQSNTTLGATNYPNGRYSFLPFAGWPWITSPPGYAAAADPPGTLLDANFPPNPMAYQADWLTGGGHPTLYYADLMANLYNPSWVNPPQQPLPGPGERLFTCSGCTYQYSYQAPATLDPAGFSAVATTMPPQRNSGLGVLPDNVTPAISFQKLGGATAVKGANLATSGPILKMLGKWDPVTNPTGLRMPAYGDYTPLTGALTNVRDYLQTEIDADPQARCGRKYYVMLLTDGEEQPALAGNDPIGAVKALRNMTSGGVAVDVKTFVIGFGLLGPSPQLNAMAREGGTSVSASDLKTPDLSASGVAFDGSSPQRLLASLEAVFGSILEGFFTRSKPAVNLAGTEMYVGYFRLLFNGQEWQGKLDAIDITQGTFPTLADTVTDADYTYYWRYGDEQGTPQPTGSSINKQLRRTVYTSLDPNTGNRIYFDYSGCTTCASASGWNTNPNADQTLLETRMGLNAKETIALLLNPGAPTNAESFTFGAKKISRASDIFHSDPAIIEGATQSNAWPDPGPESAAYQAFRNSASVQSREKTVYIGANDGMLHAVRDDVSATRVVGPQAGEERWAYVPNQLLPNLHLMRDSHTFGVDGSVAVADVCGSTIAGAPCDDPLGWKTLLVGSLGRGGNGIYALDITDPTDPKVKWERSADPTMAGSSLQVPRYAQTWGAPVIGRTSVGGIGGKVWSVFIGGGVAPAVDPSGTAWGNAIYVLDAATGQPLFDGVTKAAFKIWNDPNDDPAGVVTDHPNGVASRPTLYRPGDNGTVERVYFNDTEGKMWRMRVSSPNITTWDPNPNLDARDVFFDPANAFGDPNCVLDINGVATPILDATTGLPVVPAATLPLPKPRPMIFNRPMLALDQTGLVNAYVGTGDTDHPNDPTGYDYFFGVTDLGSGCGRPRFALRFSQNEKMLADPAFLNNVIYATTYLPPSGALVCSEAGHGFLYAWDARTGKPIAAIIDPLTGNKVSKLDFSNYPQLKNSGIPSAPVVRKGKIYLAFEAQPKGRVVETGEQPVTVKVKGWQRVK